MPTTKNSHRLPSHVVPSRYKIMLKPDLEHFTFIGNETIYLTISKPTQEIVLHAIELEISNAKLKHGEKSFTGKIKFNPKKETATIRFSKRIPKGEAELFLSFKGILNDKMKGFYRSQYDVDGVSTHMAVTQFESTDARRAFPSFDEPSLKAVFDVTLMIPKDLTAISNTIEDGVTEHEAGYKLVQFAPTPKMSTYLLAFIVGKFEYVESWSKEGVLIRVFVTPGKKKQANFALETAKKVLSFYNNYFQIPYPLPVLDLVAIPDFAAGAMENWGAVTFRETTLLVDLEHSSSANKQWVALVIAHELAHMWFGNLVTMEWWTHLWLNEGFACFIEYLAVNEIYPQFDIWTQFLANEHNSALNLDGLKNTHSIEIPVKHPSEINEIFDEVSYAKGASIIKMLATYLGETNFRDGLRLYLKKHSYQNATTEHLWDAFSKVSKEDIRTLMRNWTQKPGYPVVAITEKQKALNLSQKRFFISPISAKKTTDQTLWNIPLIVKTSKSKNVEKIIFKTKNLDIKKPGDSEWITINSTESSFIRVAYPEKYIENFKKGIVSGELSHLDKIGLIRDAFDLAQSGLTSTKEALILAREYKKETDYTVWLELAGGIHEISSLVFDQKLLFSKYKEFAKSIFTNIVAKQGWDKKPGEKHTDALLRSIALYGAGTYGDMSLVTKAKILFTDFFINKKHLDPDIRGVVYALTAENGGDKEYKVLMQAYKAEPLHQEKDRIARGLASFIDPTILSKVLAWSITSEVRLQDAPRILYAVFANPAGRELAWEFLASNWEFYSKKFAGSHGFSTVIEGAENFVTVENAKKVEAFFRKHHVSQLARTMKQVVEQIYTNADWLDRDKDSIAAFLA